MFHLIWTNHFSRAATIFAARHPELRDRFARFIRQLERDPLEPILRLHPLHGNLRGMHAVNITRAYRITLILRMERREVVLIDVGSHDDVYR